MTPPHIIRLNINIVKIFFSKYIYINFKIKDTFIDGGDCCFTGKEFLIGLSTRTNQKLILVYELIKIYNLYFFVLLF